MHLSHAHSANYASHDASDLPGAASSHPESCSSEMGDTGRKLKWNPITMKIFVQYYIILLLM